MMEQQERGRSGLHNILLTVSAAAGIGFGLYGCYLLDKHDLVGRSAALFRGITYEQVQQENATRQQRVIDERISTFFDQVDVNKDDVITREEYGHATGGNK